MANTRHVGIIGGGLAGLSAAATLAEKGIKTTLFEAGGQLGGRARNVTVSPHNETIQLDNGQHILLGAYQETLKLLAMVGVSEDEAFLRLPLTLNVNSLGKHPSLRLSTSKHIPFPLNQLLGFLFCKGLTLSERFSVIRFMLSIKQADYKLATDLALNDYLKQQKQSDKTISLLWEPLCLAALNTPLALASSQIFLNILKDTFSKNKCDSDLLLPKLGLSELFSQPILDYINSKQAHVLTNHRVTAVKANNQGFVVESKNQAFNFSHVIIATTSRSLPKIVANLPKLANTVEMVETYRYQPIVTVYLQYPSNNSLPEPMLGLAGTISQWVFDRGALCGQAGLMAVIISAEGRHQSLSQEALASAVSDELTRAFPKLDAPIWHQVIAEKRATFSCDVGLPRPSNRTNHPNLLLAGDYTYATYPATIEGAVRSGTAAANMIEAS